MTSEQLLVAMQEWSKQRGYEPNTVRVRSDIWREVLRWANPGGFRPFGAHHYTVFGCNVEVVHETDAPGLEFTRTVTSLSLPDVTPVEMLQLVMRDLERAISLRPGQMHDAVVQNASVLRRFILTLPGQHLDEPVEAVRSRVVELS